MAPEYGLTAYGLPLDSRIIIVCLAESSEEEEELAKAPVLGIPIAMAAARVVAASILRSIYFLTGSEDLLGLLFSFV